MFVQNSKSSVNAFFEAVASPFELHVRWIRQKMTTLLLSVVTYLDCEMSTFHKLLLDSDGRLSTNVSTILILS